VPLLIAYGITTSEFFAFAFLAMMVSPFPSPASAAFTGSSPRYRWFVRGLLVLGSCVFALFAIRMLQDFISSPSPALRTKSLKLERVSVWATVGLYLFILPRPWIPLLADRLGTSVPSSVD